MSTPLAPRNAAIPTYDARDREPASAMAMQDPPAFRVPAEQALRVALENFGLVGTRVDDVMRFARQCWWGAP